MENTDTNTTADVARVARIRLARAHDVAIGRSTDGPWVTMPKTSWGAYATSVHAPDGSVVTFRATSASSATGLSSAIVWT